VNGWTLFDFVFFGPSPPVSIESRFPLDVTTKRLIDLSQPDSTDDPEMPELSVGVDGENVVMSYRPYANAPRGSFSYLSGPVFRGRLIDNGNVRVMGTFGLDDTTRWLGLTAVILALSTTFASTVPIIGYFGVLGWALPVFFMIATLGARFAGADDMRLIANNLRYALRGDVDSN